MTVFCCVDDFGGMLFGGRRQSRDRMVIEDVERVAEDGFLYISDFSEKLFALSRASVICVPEPLKTAPSDAFVFVENFHLKEHLDKIDTLVIYRWQRHYPSDFKLDINPEKEGFTLKSRRKFKGTSHEEILREDYVK